jgi:hypothetical protein
VPQFDRSLVHACRHCPASTDRFLIWPTPYYSIPPQYACAIESRVATFEPPPVPDLGPLRPEINTVSQYPAAAIYRLRPLCVADAP